MSTRSQWSFREKGQQIALIYKHSDGYPDNYHGGFAVWQRFVDKVVKDAETGIYGNRFDDAEYLAARFVYFLLVCENKETNLNFGGVGISKDLHGDIEYIYEIDCDNSNAPVLRCKKIYTGKYVNQHGLEISKHGSNKPRGSVTVKGKTFNSVNDLPKTPSWIKKAANRNFANDSHLKLKRDSQGHFIKMDDIAEFEYPHNGLPQFRTIKVINETPDYIEGIQINGENTGYKKFKKSNIRIKWSRYKAYASDIV